MKRYFLLVVLAYAYTGCAKGASEADTDTLQNAFDTASETFESTSENSDHLSKSTDSLSDLGEGAETGDNVTDETGNEQNTDADTADFADSSNVECDLPEQKYLSVDEVHTVWETHCPRMMYLNVVDATFYNLGHIPGSIEIPWDSLASRLDEVNKNQTIVIYCRKGIRSENAYTTLDNADYPHLYIMKDGIEPWIAAGYETESIEK